MSLTVVLSLVSSRRYCSRTLLSSAAQSMPKLTNGRRFHSTTTAAKPLGDNLAAGWTNASTPKAAATAAVKPKPTACKDLKITTSKAASDKFNIPGTFLRMNKIASTKDAASGALEQPYNAKPAVSDTTKSDKEESQLSRGQRKRQAKREQYLRKERMVLSSLKVKNDEKQAKRIDGLDAIREALLATVSSTTCNNATAVQQRKPCFLKTNRGRKWLVEKEVTQMNLVLQHPSFRSDPLTTIREHLLNTMKQEPSPILKAKTTMEKAHRKRKKSKFRASRSRNR